jgi:D-beta-D-heptose 7-phosphate kinase/D-beta-D-heptose 1-phosphate adenosyltransferase
MDETPQLAQVGQAIRTRMDGKRALVVGDLMLDKYIWGQVTRISPEAPVPVVRHGREADHEGGAGNVAANIAGLGLDVAVAGFVGADLAGAKLREIFKETGIDGTGIVTLDDRPTIIKTRIIGGHQHVLRIDVEDLRPIRPDQADELLGNVLRRLSDGFDCLVLSDYAKGVLGDRVCTAVIAEARKRDTPVFVDPKGLDFSRYRGATVLTPNLSELAAAARLGDVPIGQIIDAGRRFVDDLELDFMVLTRGPDGMTLIGHTDSLESRAMAQEVFDVSGAGDTAIAALAAGHVAGLTGASLLHLANLAASIVVGKVGTVAVQRDWILQALDAKARSSRETVYPLDELAALVAEWRARGDRIVFTNGCFDILHEGHVTSLRRAAEEGDRLIVALNDDRSVRDLKGPSRPVNSERARAAVVSALSPVDAVILFNTATPLPLIQALRPDVLVKGGDYSPQDIVGAREVESWGGRVVVVPLVEGYSTTSMIKKMSGD